MSEPRCVSNPPNPWHSSVVELLGPAPEVELRIYEEQAGSILSQNESPDLPFRWSINPYRGCFHACAYCYARPSHQYLDWGAGTDFDRRIVVKTNAAELLRERLGRRGWKREPIAFSGVTDCYQPVEAVYSITRSCLEACADFKNPVGVITKGALVERDIDLIRAIHGRSSAMVYVSIPFADDAAGRAIEPFAPSPSRRFRTLKRIAAAGIPTGVSLAPCIPGLNDHEIPEILERARDAGAQHAFIILLRLPAEVGPVFEERLHASFPDRAKKVMSALAAMRGGRVQDSRFGHRMVGAGPRWQVVEQLFQVHCQRLGLRSSYERIVPGGSKRKRQGELFDC